MSQETLEETNTWWIDVRHGGMLLSAPIIQEILPNGPKRILDEDIILLRDAYTNFQTDKANRLHKWLDVVFEKFLRHNPNQWLKETRIPSKLKVRHASGELLRPNRILMDSSGDKIEERYLIKIDEKNKRVGMGRGRTVYGKFVELLRKTNVQIGVLTNGIQFRLIYAGLDHDSWIEWDAEKWFEDPSNQLLASFKFFCGEALNIGLVEGKWPLLYWIQQSRKKQGDLATVLGEQIREAIELLLEDLDKAAESIPNLLDPLIFDPETGKRLSEKEELDFLFQATIRIIMRLVIILFAESRELLPKSVDIYSDSYGIEGLYQLLEQSYQDEGEESLQNGNFAWARIISLFKLVYNGSAFSDIPIPYYGGQLFKPSDDESNLPISRALSIFEECNWTPSDLTVLKILRLLKIGKVKVRRGRSTTWVKGPVDFSELRTEYIGMMYEGLLDYSLKRCSPDEGAIIILNLGLQPGLPLKRLENLSNKELKRLMQTLSKEKIESSPDVRNGELVEEDLVWKEEKVKRPSEIQEIEERVVKWAERAVFVSNIVKKPKSKNLENRFEETLRSAIRNLYKKIIIPGRTYLVRGGGNRKGSGTFYTKPQLVFPTVQKVLEPLVYIHNQEDMVPQQPEEILKLKIVDPAMGSGSFLVAALKYLTEILRDSLIFYKKIKQINSTKAIVTLPIGKESKGNITEVLLPSLPEDDDFDEMLKSRLKRYIVENCIYGVDINPLAVELAKLSLWVETLDPKLPFTFLDHNLKVGNSLIGCRLNNYLDYPIMAWEREAGDDSHTKGKHYQKNEWNKKIENRKATIKKEMVTYIQTLAGQRKLTDYFEKGHYVSYKKLLPFFNKLHFSFNILNVYDMLKKELLYREIRESKDFQDLKLRFDLWCSIWFWSPERLDICPSPLNFFNPSEDTITEIKRISEEYKFFHWELEFPDVFLSHKNGFDAVVGNPPWEIIRSQSNEYFSELDPLFRTYSRQEKAKSMQNLFNRKKIERSWLEYLAKIKSYSNWFKNLKNCFGDPNIPNSNTFSFKMKGISKLKSMKLHNSWRESRLKRKLVKSTRIFTFQGKRDITTDKLFTELFFFLLSPKGRLGIILPSNFYSSSATKSLRLLYIKKGKVNSIYSFENKYGIFPGVHKSAKFCTIVTEKTLKSEIIDTFFMRTDLSDLEKDLSSEKFLVKYPVNLIDRFSPKHKILIEFQDNFDLKILKKIYENSYPVINHPVWKIRSVREYDMTGDSELFPPVKNWIERGFEPSDYGIWRDKEGNEAFPLYEGRMVGNFNLSRKGWVSGKGRSAKWKIMSFEKQVIQPQFLMSKEDTIKKAHPGLKIAYMRLASATNTRTVIAALNKTFPHGATAPVLLVKDGTIEDYLILTGLLNSFVFDYSVRLRLGGTALSWFVLEESPLPHIDNSTILSKYFMLCVARLSFIQDRFAPEWLYLKNKFEKLKKESYFILKALTNHERLRLMAIINAIAAIFYNLSLEDFTLIVNNDENNPKGFWRVDNDKPLDIRLTTLSQIALRDALDLGPKKFIELDWQIPKNLQIKYMDIIGKRFLEWQTNSTIEESWDYCEKNAKKILGEEVFTNYLSDVDNLYSRIYQKGGNTMKTKKNLLNKQRRVEDFLSKD